ncbi:MAG: 2-oxoacid:acceptor oxidoreductase family protein [Candidatus Aenigmatarchaeota archaeon]
MKAKLLDEYNIVVVGVGGQGLLTLAGAIARAALEHGYEVRAAELHGLSQRFGSIETSLRFGKNIYSPIVRQASADLVIALEPAEAIKACYYASQKTAFLLDTKPIVPNIMYQEGIEYPSIDEIKARINIFSKKIITVNASEDTKALTGSTIQANIYLLGRAASESLIPLKKEWLIKGIEEVVPPATVEANKKVFEAGWRSKFNF